MKRSPVQKVQIAIFILSLILTSFACNAPPAVRLIVEAAMEECNIVKRDVYELSAIQLGKEPETPKYPASAVYEVCFINMEVSSARMIDGKPPEVDQQPEIENNKSIPAGTYTGAFPWSDTSINELYANESTVEISSSGLVSGSAIFHHGRVESHNIGELQCTSSTEYKYTYTISGQIADDFQEPVQVQKSIYEINDWSNCGKGIMSHRDEQCSCEGLLTVKDGELLITCGAGDTCGAYITAKK